MTSPPSLRATLDRQGNITATLPVITSVGIADLADVQSHNIVRIVGSVSHHVRFVGGGELCYVYNTRGELIELSAVNVKVSISSQHRLVFAPYRRNP
jgi:hypothetical protein